MTLEFHKKTDSPESTIQVMQTLLQLLGQFQLSDACKSGYSINIDIHPIE